MTRRARQRGVALLLLLLIVLTIGGTFGIQALSLSVTKVGVENPAATRVLAQSKAALLAWAQTIDPVSNSGYRAVRPGSLPYPDVYGNATLNSPIMYDGMQDIGCIRSTWNGTSNLRNPQLAFATAATMRCIGKIPWRLLGIDVNQSGTADVAGRITDSFGVVPWYAVSANLVTHVDSSTSPCPRRLDALIASPSTIAGSCGTSQSASAISVSSGA